MMRGQNKSLGLLWTQVDTRLMIKFVLGFITGRITSMPNKTKSVEKDIENWEQIAYTQLCEVGRIYNIDCDLYDHPEYTLINETAQELAWAEAQDLDTLDA